jgi:hypothetical protein
MSEKGGLSRGYLAIRGSNRAGEEMPPCEAVDFQHWHEIQQLMVSRTL